MGGFSWWHWGILVLLFVPKILYLLSAQKTLNTIPDEHRKLSSGLVWLGLIPIFYWIWNFIVISKTRQSFQSLQKAGNLEGEVDGGFTAGIISSIAAVAGAIGNALVGQSSENDVSLILAVLGLIISLTWLVTWIINWVQLVSSRKAILQKK